MNLVNKQNMLIRTVNGKKRHSTELKKLVIP